MAGQTIRVGIVGAGANTRARHVPGLRAVEGVEIVGVVNRRAESTQRVAEEFGIPKTYSHWQELVDDDAIDAVVIGAWPYLHCPVTLAALGAGKHVMTEARMSANLAEARQMLEKAGQSDRVAQVVPSPIGLAGNDVMCDLMTEGFVGQVREVFVRNCSPMLADPSTPLHWRQRKELSGVNMLSLGIVFETVARWVGGVAAVMADACTFIAQRQDPESGAWVNTDLPDSLRVLAELASGGRALYHVSGVTHFAPSTAVEIYGADGTLVYDITSEKILGARVGEQDALQEIPIPAEKRREWTVEADFIAAIRGERPIELTTFEDGLRYMEFTEAVYRSAVGRTQIDLPLEV
jgi:predicted dehydrogenase